MTTEITKKVIASFISSFNETDDISLSDMKKRLTSIYKTVSTGKKVKVVNPDKKKRVPTTYNKFLKEKMAELKENNSTLNAQEKMSYVSELWKEHKNTIVDVEETEVKVDEIEVKVEEIEVKVDEIEVKVEETEVKVDEENKKNVGAKAPRKALSTKKSK